MSDHFDPTPAVFHKRINGSKFMSFGNPIRGFHNQFDFYGVEKLGEHIATAVNAYDKQRALIETLTAALTECDDYFDNRADADCDQDGYTPNEEMKRLQTVRDALAAAKQEGF